jgi:hypothetical protein
MVARAQGVQNGFVQEGDFVKMPLLVAVRARRSAGKGG